KRLSISQKEFERVQSKVNNLEALVDILKTASYEEALQQLQELRRDTTSASDPISTSMDLPIGVSLQSYTDSGIHNLEAKSSSSISSTDLETSLFELELYSIENLPPRSVIETSIAGFYSSLSSLFYVMEERTCQAMIEYVFDAGSPIFIADLGEICGLAALGGGYVPEPLPLVIREKLIRTARVHKDQSIESHPIRGMRAFALQALYNFSEKRLGVRMDIQSGLALARWVGCANVHGQATDKLSPVEYAEYTQLYCSLICLESWFSSTVGYPSELTRHEIASVDVDSCVTTRATNFHAQMASIGVLTADVYRAMYVEEQPRFSAVQELYRRLDEWPSSLPETKRLGNMIHTRDPENPEQEDVTLLFVHMLYLSSMILVHKPLLVALADRSPHSRASPVSPGSEAFGECTYNRAILGAHQLVRVNNLLAWQRTPFRHFWLCMSQTYSACTVLLHEAAQTMLILVSYSSAIDDALERAFACIQALGEARESDPGHVAGCYVDYAKPLHAELVLLWRDIKPPTRNGGGAEQRVLDLGTVAARVVELLRKPFGHPGTLEDADEEGSSCGFMACKGKLWT
ncbi:hypothetical protein P152DRAFT_390279, partial [Eremomyces bilateralis CBS 781.70]